jgi:hypothetical protein
LLIAITGTTTKLSVPLQGSGGNPIPNITSLSRASVYVGGPGFTLVVTGSGFIASSVVNWNNSPLLTTYVTGNQGPGASLRYNQHRYGLCICQQSNPRRRLLAVRNCSNYNARSIDIFDFPYFRGGWKRRNPVSVTAEISWLEQLCCGMATVRPTTYINWGQLQVQLTSGDMAKAQIGQLAVSDPALGGLSMPATFNVTYPAKVTILDLPANDLVWDPYLRKIYASLPSSYGSAGNSIAVINPLNGEANYYFAGSEPAKLALSADARYLYTGLNGAGTASGPAELHSGHRSQSRYFAL